MNRREFLGWVGVGGLATYLPVAIAACSPEPRGTSPTTEPTPPPAPAPVPRADGFLDVGTVEQLNQDGQILNKKFDLIVVRNPEDNSLVALNPACPHQGCTVTWNSSNQNLVCPCHGSTFAVDGQVTKGPATEPLANYVIKEENGSIFVKVA